MLQQVLKKIACLQSKIGPYLQIWTDNFSYLYTMNGNKLNSLKIVCVVKVAFILFLCSLMKNMP